MSSFCNIDFKVQNNRANSVIDMAKHLESGISTKPIQNDLNSKLNVDIFDEYFNDKTIDMKVKQKDSVEFENKKILNVETEKWAYSVEPDKTIRGAGLNRWYNLYKNPQDNCIESFPRIGMNSVLDVLDNHKPCKVTQEMLDGFGV
tara:strand:- start:16050 stop:16487 length:438 start_codon:yes stop_codon:yes gene_type:complete